MDAKEIAVRISDDLPGNFDDNYLIRRIAAALESARAEAIEEAAKVADSEEELAGEPSETLLETIIADPVFAMRAAVRATKRNIAAAIRELAKGKV